MLCYKSQPHAAIDSIPSSSLNLLFPLPITHLDTKTQSIMASFNPSKPIDDPTVWYPKGMYVKKEATEVAPSREVFILAQSDMASLNRYVWTAKLLPTTRDEYKQSLAITDGGVITREVWSAADNVLTTYGTVRVKGVLCLNSLKKLTCSR